MFPLVTVCYVSGDRHVAVTGLDPGLRQSAAPRSEAVDQIIQRLQTLRHASIDRLLLLLTYLAARSAAAAKPYCLNFLSNGSRGLWMKRHVGQHGL